MVYTRELSTVSLPTRERSAAKAKVKARKTARHGAPNDTATGSEATMRPAIPATLASTREPRRNRGELTFAKSKGGLVAKSVIRREAEEPENASVPFLPGQEDLARIENERHNRHIPPMPDVSAPEDYEHSGEEDSGSSTEQEDILPDMEEFLSFREDAEGSHAAQDVNSVGSTAMYTIDAHATAGTDMDTELNLIVPPAENSMGIAPMETDDKLFECSNYAQGGMDLSGADPEDLQALFGGLNPFNGNDFGPFPPIGSTFNSSDFNAMANGLPEFPMHSHPTNFLGNPPTNTALGFLGDDATAQLATNLPSYTVSMSTNTSITLPNRVGTLIPDVAPGSHTRTPRPRCDRPSPYVARLLSPAPASPGLPARTLTPAPAGPSPRLGTPRPNQPRPLATMRGEMPILSRTPVSGHHHRSGSLTPARRTTRALVSEIRSNVRLSATQPDTHPPAQTASHLPGPVQIPAPPISVVSTPLRRTNSAPDVIHDHPHSMPGPIGAEPNTAHLTSWETTPPQTPDATPSDSDNYSSHNTRRLIPTIQDIERNIAAHYKLAFSNRRDRHIPEDMPLLANRLPRMRLLQEEEKRLMLVLEYFLLNRMVNFEAWLQDPKGALELAMQYGEKIMGRPRTDMIETPRYEDLVLSKMSNLRSDSLRVIFQTVSRMLNVFPGNKTRTKQLMDNDLFLYPNEQIVRAEQYRSDVITEVLLDIFFRSGKQLGLVFIPQLCVPDDKAECATWHKKLRDRSATRGLSVAAIAFAATTIYYTLDKMHRNLKTLHFTDQGYKTLHWDRYFRSLVAHPHLGALRKDLLERIKQEHLQYWPAEDYDDVTDLQLAW
ncbi:hypothetical protein FRC08_004740 [Ceratobasidium sp. 394]|nr:hypothetical protein FRC08_004740 [Ceratobasidium sp. 394]